MTRIILICSILVVCVGTFIYLYKRFKLDIISGGILFMVILGVYLGTTSFVNLNTLSLFEDSAYKSVVKQCGSENVRVYRGKVQVLVDSEWVDTGKINIIGSLSSKEIVLECKGKIIYCGSSGIGSTLRALKSFGFIQ